MRYLLISVLSVTVAFECPSEHLENDINSGCWRYQNDKCVKTNAACVSLDCYEDRMEATIRPETFGVEPDEYHLYESGQMNITVNEDHTCESVYWNPTEQMFKVNASLFDCNMEVGATMVGNNEYITFRMGMYKEPERMMAIKDYFLKLTGSVSIELECRYECIVTANSPMLTVRRKPQHTLDLRFEVDIRTAYATHEDLLEPETDMFQTISGQLVYQVENNWQGPKPWKVGINHFMFFYDDLATAVKDKDFDGLKDREEFFNNTENERNKYDEDGNLIETLEGNDNNFPTTSERKRRSNDWEKRARVGNVMSFYLMYDSRRRTDSPNAEELAEQNRNRTVGGPRETDYIPTRKDKQKGRELLLTDPEKFKQTNETLIPVRDVGDTCEITDDELVKVRVRVFYKHLTEDNNISDEDVRKYKKNIIDTIEEVKKIRPPIIDPCQNTTIPPPVVDNSTEVHIEDAVINYGTWEDAFTLGLYRDPNFLHGLYNQYIGHPMYVKIDWGLDFERLKYFVRDCQYLCGDTPEEQENNNVDVVKGACYSDIVHAHLMNENNEKVVAKTSTFALKSFGFKNTWNSCTICCELKVCVKDLTCTVPEVCPAEPAFFKYSMFGNNKFN